MQRAIVTGAGGFVGNALLLALHERGIETIGVSRRPLAVPCRLLEADLREPEALADVLSPETTVFHLAAHASVGNSVRDPRRDMDENVTATLEVLESVREAGCSLVFASSAAVFDPASPLPHREGAPKRPVSPYGAAKLACEAYVSVYHACHGLDVKIARLFNVYGPTMRRFAIYDFYRKILEADERLEILGDGEQLRDYLYIDDAVAAFLAIAERGEAGQDYNVGSGSPVRTLDLASTMCRLLGREDLPVVPLGGTFPGDVKAWYADVAKLRYLGWAASIELGDGLRNVIDALESATAFRAVREKRR